MENGNSRGLKRLLYEVAISTSPERFEVYRRGDQKANSYPTFEEAQEEVVKLAKSPDKPDYDFYSVHSFWGKEYRHDLIIRL